MVAAIVAVSFAALAAAQETEAAQAWAGLAGMPLVDGLPERHGLDRPAVLVVGLAPEGPATRAGLQTSDILTSADGDAISEPYDWLVALRGRPPGTVVELEILREDTTLSLELTLEARPEEDEGS